MLEPLQTLLDTPSPSPSLLTPELERLYGGPLAFPPPPPGRPLVVANFVTGVDGVVSYVVPEDAGSQPIFGDAHDRLVMALLRLLSDTVLVGRRTLAAGMPRGTLLWRSILPQGERAALATLFEAAEARLALPRRRRHVVVSASGAVNLQHPMFVHADVNAVVATTESGREALLRSRGRDAARLRCLVLPERGTGLDLRALLAALLEDGAARVLSEGGPSLHGALEQDGLVDELFLTTSPWVPGQDAARPRPTFSGAAHPPGATPRTALVSLKRHANHLFARRRYVR